MSNLDKDGNPTLMVQEASLCQTTTTLPRYTIAKTSEGQMLAELIRTTVTESEAGISNPPGAIYTAELPAELAGSLPEGTVLQMGSDSQFLTVACLPGLASLNEHTGSNVSSEKVETIPSQTTVINVGEAIEDRCNALMSSNVPETQREEFSIENGNQDLDLDEIIGTATASQSEAPPTSCEAPCEKNSHSSEELTSSSELQAPKDDVVFIDVSQPIQLSHNSLIVVNGQRCVLQQCEETGQVIAYPIKEPGKVKRKRGRPRKQDQVMGEENSKSAPVLEEEEEDLEEMEEASAVGTVDLTNEDGSTIRRSRRRRKKARFLQDYATGSLQMELGSDEGSFSESEVHEQAFTLSRKKGVGRGRARKPAQATETQSQTNLFPFLQQPKRGRGRPRRYGVSPPTMQGFLIQTADGQNLMMQVPSNSIPSHMTLQEVAENIASSLNTHMANQIAGLVMPGLKDALNGSEGVLNIPGLPEQPDGISASSGQVSSTTSIASTAPCVPTNSLSTVPTVRKRGRPRKQPLPNPTDHTTTPPIPAVPTILENQAETTRTGTCSIPVDAANGTEEGQLQNLSLSDVLPPIESVDVYMVLNKDSQGTSEAGTGDMYLTPVDLQTQTPVVEDAMTETAVEVAAQIPSVSGEGSQFILPVSEGCENLNNEEGGTTSISAVEPVPVSAITNTNGDLDCVTNIELAVQEEPLLSGLETDQMIVGLPAVSAQTTVIPVPDTILPLLSNNEESPVKIGLKASEKELQELCCPECQFQAYYTLQYHQHMLTHENAHKCKCCTFVVLDEGKLVDHYKKQHPRNICNVCNHTTEYAYLLKRHMLRHNGGYCQCPLCGKTYKDQYILKMHIKMVHMPASVLFECFLCGKKFNRRAHLTRHLRTHDPKKSFECASCDYKSSEKSDLTKHMVIHNKPRHTCKLCGKAFRHLKNLDIHLKRHKGQRDFKCGVCDFYGYTFTDIRKHIERRHSDSQTIICDRCGQAFATEAHMKEHQMSEQCQLYMITNSTTENTDFIHVSDLVQQDQQEISQEVNVLLDQNEGISIVPEVEVEECVMEETEADGSSACPGGAGGQEDQLGVCDASHILVSEDGQLFTSNSQLAVLAAPQEGPTQLALISETGEVSTLPTSSSGSGTQGYDDHTYQDLTTEVAQPVTLLTGEGLMLVV